MAMMAYQTGGPAASKVSLDGLTEQIQMFFQVKSLPRVGGTVDPFCLLYQRNPVTNQMVLIHTTEVKTDTTNPQFTEPATNPYSFEIVQDLEVRVYHKAKGVPPGESASHKFLGCFRYSQSQLMMAPGNKLSGPFVEGGACQVIVRGEVVTHTRDIFKSTIKCHNLPKMNGFLGLLGKSDPFVRISRLYDDGTYTGVMDTSVRKGTLSPTWPGAQKEMTAICNGDIDRNIRVEVFDYDQSGRHKPMGYVLTTLRAILDSGGQKMKLTKAFKGLICASGAGYISFLNPVVENHPTLVQFLKGGLDINLNVAIDFTQSNGHPSERTSLHRISNPGDPENDYQKAIRAVGGVVEAYDHEKKFAVYGFGARLGGSRDVQHCFPVYGGDSIVIGVDGVLNAYKECVTAVEFAGPTYFKHLIDNAGALAQSMNCTQDNQRYTVLLILTDGVIDDMDATIASIVQASYQPLSVIIVGIGKEDFTNMNKLDADDQKLEHAGVAHHRDIVQFVPFKKFHSKGATALAQNVLAEIPSQILKYMESKGIKPNDSPPPPPFAG